ncbi:hypothetical protein ACH4TE_04575 [Streptomyces sioyaensis]|uniref:hypothetical protein n=1 Tax=Streptomyces sioyaensis TaxID=67364 RepID=UPI00378C094B
MTGELGRERQLAGVDGRGETGEQHGVGERGRWQEAVGIVGREPDVRSRLAPGCFIGVFFQGGHAGLVFGLWDLPENRETFQFGGLGFLEDLAARFRLFSAVLDGVGALLGTASLYLLGDQPSGFFEVTVVPA